MRLSTISAYETTAEKFFSTLAVEQVDLLLDTRLKNTNQLAGFTKRNDLEFFVPRLLHATYVHDLLFAPAPTVLERYLNHNLDWSEYSQAYREDIEQRAAIEKFFEHYGSYQSVCLLGTATKKRRSHVEVLQEMLDQRLGA